MNITTTLGSSIRRKPWAAAGAPSWVAAIALRWAQGLHRAPLLLWLLVFAAALLAFFVHLLNEQVLRGQLLREEQRAAATRPAPRTAGEARHSVNLLVASRQPMTRP